MKIYLAHPITGLTYEEVMDYYTFLSSALQKAGYEVLCPMAGKGYLRNEFELKAQGYEFPVSTNHAIFTRDHWMVQQSDIVLCDLTGSQKVSIGCMMEMAWASHLGKHVVLVMEEGNLHEHSFVLEAASIRFTNTLDAGNYLLDLVGGVAR